CRSCDTGTARSGTRRPRASARRRAASRSWCSPPTRPRPTVQLSGMAPQFARHYVAGLTLRADAGSWYPSPPRPPMLEHRLAKLAAGATFLLLIIGGMVNATGSSLACHEPTFVCNGSFFPEMSAKTGVLYE